MRRRKKNKFPAKYVLLFMVIFCIAIIGSSIRYSVTTDVANTAVGYVIIPMQKGINIVGKQISDFRDNFISKEELQAENQELKNQIADLQSQMNQVQINQKELDQLKDLYQMDQAFADYDKVAATVIGKDSGNWFTTFLIDKGSNAGISEGMNVIASGGLAGIVIDVGPNFSTIRSIVDDSSNISCKDIKSSDLCIVSGSLKSMNESSQINFSDLRDSENTVSVGDQIATSNISDLYLENIPVGFITDITEDSNKLTKSGKIATIVDFEHLEKVFVILKTKELTTKQEGE